MMKDELIREECGERLDDLQCDGLYLIQNPDKFCFGIDAVLLSNFVKVKKDWRKNEKDLKNFGYR